MEGVLATLGGDTRDELVVGGHVSLSVVPPNLPR